MMKRASSGTNTQQKGTKPRPLPVVAIMAALVVVFAGVKVAAPIIVPFLLALFIFIIFRPFAAALRKRGVPQWLALTLVILLILLFTFMMAMLLTLSVQNFSQKIPYYNNRLAIYQEQILDLAKHYSIPVKDELLVNLFDPGKVMKFAAGALYSSLSNLVPCPIRSSSSLPTKSVWIISGRLTTNLTGT